jgi:nucleotide-binding universal stress UspA family protein
MNLIVVGVDGSECGKAALRFAAEEAALRGARLRAVCAWEVPVMAFAGAWGFPAELISELEEGAKKVVGKALSEVADLQPQVVGEGASPNGPAGSVLLHEAEDADLLVVGSRGLGSFAGMLLGSVSQHVAHRAHCPVVIVHQGPAASA